MLLLSNTYIKNKIVANYS